MDYFCIRHRSGYCGCIPPSNNALPGTIPYKPEAETSPDSNVEKNRRLLLERSKVGLVKYGCTTEVLTLRQSLQHALEEALDMANYLQAAISRLDAESEAKCNGC